MQTAPARDVPEVLERSRIAITPPFKRQRVDERQDSPAVEGSSLSSRRLDKGKGTKVATSLVVPPALEEPLVMPRSKINDPQFQVPDVIDHHLNEAFRLHPRFSFPNQAIYTYFREDSWDKFVREGLLKC